MIAPEKREELHRRLDGLIDNAPDFDSITAGSDDDIARGAQATEFRRWREAQLHLGSALRLAAEIVGERTIVEHANAQSPASLSLASRFLDLASMSLAPPETYLAMKEIAFELRAIESGELPRLIRAGDRSKKLPPNIYRRWHFQLAAICWDYSLGSCGYSTQERRRIIEDSYGHPWRTIAGWLPAIREGLGSLVVDTRIQFARRDAERWAHAGISNETIVAAVTSDGAAYIADNRIAKGMTAR